MTCLLVHLTVQSQQHRICLWFVITGKYGRFTGSSGLQIAYLSGVESKSGKGEDFSFTADDASSLIAPVVNDTNFKGIDILITSQWPENVEKYASSAVRICFVKS